MANPNVLGYTEINEQISQTQTAENIGKITLLEALAEDSGKVAMDGLARTTMQMNVDFDD